MQNLNEYTCQDCGKTFMGKHTGSARCPECWEDRCGHFPEPHQCQSDLEIPEN